MLMAIGAVLPSAVVVLIPIPLSRTFVLALAFCVGACVNGSGPETGRETSWGRGCGGGVGRGGEVVADRAGECFEHYW